MRSAIGSILLGTILCLLGCGGDDATMLDGGRPRFHHDGGLRTDGGIALAPRPSPIAAENQQPGSDGWRLVASASDHLAGYADAPSHAPGETVAIHAAADGAESISWSLWRMGWYGGAWGRQIASGGPVAVPAAGTPLFDAATGAVSAGWPVAFSFTLAGDAVTGFYLVRLDGPNGQSYVPLVVREAMPGAPLVWPVAVNTYHAYNKWGGTSLYDNRRSDWKYGHAFAASFERPYDQGDGAGQFFSFDRWFLGFAESQGWDIAYVTDPDLEADPLLLDQRAGVLVVGHSEYWSAGMRDQVEEALQNGTGIAALGANDCYWQVRYQASPWTGAPRSFLVGYKDYAAMDPDNASDPSSVTTMWRADPVDRPENALLGVMFGSWQMTATPLVVSDASSWLWQGSGASDGDAILDLMFGESDRRFDNGQEPAGLVEEGGSTLVDHDGAVAHGAATRWVAPSGADVFAAGTWGWGPALSEPGRWDPRIQQATVNLIARLLGQEPQPMLPLDLPPGLAPPTWQAASSVTTLTTAIPAPTALAALPGGGVVVAADNKLFTVAGDGSVTQVAGGDAGDVDGPAASARFANPRGLAVGKDGTVYVCDTGNHKIKKLQNGAVSTLAGSLPGFADGQGSAAQFYTPVAMAMTPSGTLVVADLWNNRIRAVTTGGAVTTWVGNGARDVVDGPGASASLYFPWALAARADGSLVFAESEDGLVRQVSADSSHTVSTLVGQIGLMGTTDGTPDVAAVAETAALAARPDGSVLLLDAGSWRLRVWNGSEVHTVAGIGKAAEIDGRGDQASLWAPIAIATAGDGSVYVADVGGHAIRRITF